MRSDKIGDDMREKIKTDGGNCKSAYRRGYEGETIFFILIREP